MIPSNSPSGSTSFMPRSESDRAGSTFLTNIAIHTVTSATVEPADRSIPPAIMISVIPRAAMPTITVWTAIVRQLSTVRNVPVWRVNAAKSMMIRTKPDKRAKHRPHPAQATAEPDRGWSLSFSVPGFRPPRCPPLKFTNRPLRLGPTNRVGLGSDVHDLVFRPLRNGACLTHGSACHDGDPVADSEQLGQIRADHQNRRSRGRLFPDQAVDFGLGTDVDTASWLVKKEDVGPLMEQPRQCHFLLIPTGEIARDLRGAGCGDTQP